MDELAGMLTALAGGVGRSARTRYAGQIPSFEEWLMEQGYTGGGLDPDTLSFLKRAYESYAARETEFAQTGARQEEAARNNNMKSRTTEGPKSERPTGTFQDRQRAWGDARKKSWEKSAEIFYGDAKPQMATSSGGGQFPAINPIDRNKDKNQDKEQPDGRADRQTATPMSDAERADFGAQLEANNSRRNNTFQLTPTRGAGGAGPTGGGAGGATPQELADMVMSILGGNPERSNFRPYKLRGGW